ncbi:MFS transporter [Amycolatopsis pithecellobii]|uniref:MFS transporter n=1 Tax=Amycolatopsis pithecellobii TaxID=664692 RepID=A0A6N7YZU6_9PSEU|nr:MFS transporter [Amycolatopsis pithecellobii]MTD54473.1 MFS transporter [Amycolatopsis pithecellobii]
MTTKTTQAPPSRRASTGFRSVAAVYLLAMLGGTLPVPLYVLWAPAMGFGPFTTTLIFAVYAIGVVVSLILFASMSDRSGRRPLMVAALVLVAASTVSFLLAGNVVMLLVARVLSGLATGVITATATAWLEELGGPRRATVTATAANLGGLGLGPLVAGLFAQLAPAPTHLVFAVYLATLVPAVLAIALAPETVDDRRPPVVIMRRPTVPAGRADLARFASAAAAVSAGFEVNALFSSLVPGFLHQGLGVTNQAVAGGVVAVLFLSALLAQLFAPPRRLSQHWIAAALLISGVAVFVAGLWTRSLAVFVIGTVLAGAGSGLSFRRGLAVTARLADPRRRADLNASYFLAAYAGNIVPTLALGGLGQLLPLNLATSLLAAVVIAVTALAGRA